MHTKTNNRNGLPLYNPAARYIVHSYSTLGRVVCSCAPERSPPASHRKLWIFLIISVYWLYKP